MCSVVDLCCLLVSGVCWYLVFCWDLLCLLVLVVVVLVVEVVGAVWVTGKH